MKRKPALFAGGYMDDDLIHYSIRDERGLTCTPMARLIGRKSPGSFLKTSSSRWLAWARGLVRVNRLSGSG